jgi:hypothetical protein
MDKIPNCMIKSSESFLQFYQTQNEQYIKYSSDDKSIKVSIISMCIIGFIVTLFCLIL